MRILLGLFLLIAQLSGAQMSPSWFHHYRPLDSNNVVLFELKTINDTILLSRSDSLTFQSGYKRYQFNFTIDTGENVQFLISQSLNNDGLNYNCSHPLDILHLGDTGHVTICFPGAQFSPPYDLTTKYIVNSNTSKRDTLIINRHFEWRDQDTIHTSLSLGDSSLVIVEHTATIKPQMMFLNLHENESTSIEALKIVADTIPIDYIYLKHGGERRVEFSNNDQQYSIDPNRIYTKVGTEATLNENDQLDEFGLVTSEFLAHRIFQKLQKGKSVISVHNNTPDEYSIFSYLPDSSEAGNTRQLFINEAADPDDFIYTTNLLVYQAAKRDSINVILQSDDNLIDDGSLSVYCGIQGILYVNIETEHGHLKEQIRLIFWTRNIVQEILNTKE